MNTVDLLNAYLRGGESDAEKALVGKFHAHLTLALTGQQATACEEFCRQHRVKLTIVDLENLAGQKQTDVMTTSHFRERTPGATTRITGQLIKLAESSEKAGFPVKRAKLEHESLPSLALFCQHQYHEVHVKLNLPSGNFESNYDRLVRLGHELQFVPSRNPRQRTTEFVTQFVNLRIYEGDHQAADTRVEQLVSRLKQQSFDVLEVKRETVVYDTNQAQDQWWA